MKVLVVNAGSSSLKYQLFNTETAEVLSKGICERIGIDGIIEHKLADGTKIKNDIAMPNHAVAMKTVVEYLTNPDFGCIKDMSEIEAVGHRVVHGGPYFFESCLVTPEVLGKLELCRDFAPLHTGAHLMGIEGCTAVMPNTPQVLVFDTAFHQTMPEYAYTYPIPYEMIEKYKIRRYGAHGTSHRFVAKEMAKMIDKPIEETKIITCHIGNGSSISAVKGGKCIDTTMGFTPDEMSEFMNKKCGFLGISGYSSDSRDIEKGILEGNHRAYLAASILAYQVKKYIGAFTAAMDGLDAIVFTAGMGENNPELRERVCRDMTYFGIEIDTELNAKMFRQPNTVKLSTENSKVLVYLLPTNEELMIASDTEEIVKKLKK